MLGLKRFAFNGGSPFGMNGFKYSMHGGGGSKISKPIEFPADLNLPLSDNRSCAYSLTGIVIHVGGSASSGHYTACVKRSGRNGAASQWYHVDDDDVEPVTEKYVLRQKDAYLLFYSRKEVKIEFPTPPPRSMSASEATEFGRNRARVRADSISKDEQHGNPRQNRAPVADANMGPLPRKKDAVRVKTNVHPLATPIRVGQSLRVAPNSDDSSSSSSSDDSSEERRPAKKQQSLPIKQHSKIAEATSDSSSSSGSESMDDSSVGRPKNHVSQGAPVRKDGARLGASKPDTANALTTNQDSGDSSENGSSDSDAFSDDVEEKGGGGDVRYFGEPKATPQEKSKKEDKTRVVINSSDSRGKVKVMLGPRKRKA
ncbi:MAG: hypothetical protein SGILL_004579, partial [Bacillariaceae sp.]